MHFILIWPQTTRILVVFLSSLLFFSPAHYVAAHPVGYMQAKASVSKVHTDSLQELMGENLPEVSDGNVIQSLSEVTPTEPHTTTDEAQLVPSYTGKTGNPPTQLALTQKKLTHHTNEGALVGTLSSIDVDAGDTVAYALVAGEGDTDNSSFRLEGTDSTEVHANVALDYYVKSRFAIRVSATDGYGNTTQEHFVIVQSPGNAYFLADNRSVEFRFNEPVTVAVSEAVLKTAVRYSVTTAGGATTIRTLSRMDSVSVLDAKMRIRFRTAVTGAKINILIDAGTVQDAAMNKNAAITSDSFVPDRETPLVKKVSLSADNKTISLTFSENLESNFMLTPRLVTLGIFAADGGSAPTISALPASSRMDVDGNTVDIRLSTALTGARNFVRLASGFASDDAGNISPAQDSQRVVADEQAPVVQSVLVGSDAKTVTMTYDEPITVKTGTVAKIFLATNGENFTQISRMPVRTDGNKVMFTFATPLTGTLNRLRFEAGTFVDSAKNTAAEYTTDALAVDTTIPVLVSAGLGESNKIIVLRFSEPVAANMTTIKTKIHLDRDTIDSNPALDLVAADMVRLEGKVLTIELGTALRHPICGCFRLTIDKGTFFDAMNNKAESITVAEAEWDLDRSGPTITGVVVSPTNKTFIITFNEKIVVNARSWTPLTVAGFFSITNEGSEGMGTYTPFPLTATATVEGKTVTLSSAKAYKGMSFAIQVRANSFTDLSKNKNTLQTSPMFLSDVEAPW